MGFGILDLIRVQGSNLPKPFGHAALMISYDDWNSGSASRENLCNCVWYSLQMIWFSRQN